MTSKVREGIAAAQIAVEHDQAGRVSAALEHYDLAVALLQSALPLLEGKHANLRSTTEAKIAEYSLRRRQLSSVAPLSAPAAVGNDRGESMDRAKATLNEAMNADRAQQAAAALALYEDGLEQLMALLKGAVDADEKKWITGELRRHLARAEKLKETLKSAAEGLTGLKALQIADDAWDSGDYDRALPAYEQAKELLRHEPDNGAHLAHAEIRIELLVQRQNDGAFVRPIPLGHKPGEKYVDPVGEKSKFQELVATAKEKAKTLKRNIDAKLNDDDGW